MGTVWPIIRYSGDRIEVANPVQVGQNVLPVIRDPAWSDHRLLEQFKTDFAAKEVGNFTLFPSIVNLTVN
jgi:hypothetical protein